MDILKRVLNSITIALMVLTGMVVLAFTLALSVSQGLPFFLMTILVIIAIIVYLVAD